MTQKGYVTGLEGDMALVRVSRQAACAGECKEDCESCSMGKKRVIIRARNTAKAVVGDWVLLESDTKKMLGFAFMVYMFPLILAFVGYAAAFYGLHQAELSSVAAAFVLFLAAFLPAIFMNRRAERRGSLVEIIRRVSGGETGEQT